MLALGTAAPDFNLPNIDGKLVAPGDFKTSTALVVMFICNHCPYVKHLRAALAEFGRECATKNVAVVAINPNDAANYPEDGPAKMAAEATTAGYPFPYLYDETQKVAKAYRAACTPDFFLFDRGRRLVYRGQFDASRPGNGIPVTGKDLRAAVEAVLKGTQPAPNQAPSMGCNIKWKRGNEPKYSQNAKWQETR